MQPLSPQLLRLVLWNVFNIIVVLASRRSYVLMAPQIFYSQVHQPPLKLQLQLQQHQQHQIQHQRQHQYRQQQQQQQQSFIKYPLWTHSNLSVTETFDWKPLALPLRHYLNTNDLKSTKSFIKVESKHQRTTTITPPAPTPLQVIGGLNDNPVFESIIYGTWKLQPTMIVPKHHIKKSVHRQYGGFLGHIAHKTIKMDNTSHPSQYVNKLNQREIIMSRNHIARQDQHEQFINKKFQQTFIRNDTSLNGIFMELSKDTKIQRPRAEATTAPATSIPNQMNESELVTIMAAPAAETSSKAATTTTTIATSISKIDKRLLSSQTTPQAIITTAMPTKTIEFNDTRNNGKQLLLKANATTLRKVPTIVAATTTTGMQHQQQLIESSIITTTRKATTTMTTITPIATTPTPAAAPFTTLTPMLAEVASVSASLILNWPSDFINDSTETITAKKSVIVDATTTSSSSPNTNTNTNILTTLSTIIINAKRNSLSLQNVSNEDESSYMPRTLTTLNEKTREFLRALTKYKISPTLWPKLLSNITQIDQPYTINNVLDYDNETALCIPTITEQWSNQKGHEQQLKQGHEEEQEQLQPEHEKIFVKKIYCFPLYINNINRKSPLANNEINFISMNDTKSLSSAYKNYLNHLLLITFITFFYMSI